MTDSEKELAYTKGNNAAYRFMLGECLRQLGQDSPEWTAHRWKLERAAAVAMLRIVCAEHGDNDWPDTLHLADVIEKHLGRHLK